MTKDWKKELRDLGFGNQAVIVGTKRVELFEKIGEIVDKQLKQARREVVERFKTNPDVIEAIYLQDTGFSAGMACRMQDVNKLVNKILEENK